MKKLLIAALAAVACAGCVKIEDRQDSLSGWTQIASDSAWGETVMKSVKFEGHTYVVARSYHGLSIVHAESCRCRHPGAEILKDVRDAK